jgi:hypothetical protein
MPATQASDLGAAVRRDPTAHAAGARSGTGSKHEGRAVYRSERCTAQLHCTWEGGTTLAVGSCFWASHTGMNHSDMYGRFTA